jgi:hypothetical protein
LFVIKGATSMLHTGKGKRVKGNKIQLISLKNVPVHFLQHYVRTSEVDAVGLSLRKLPNVEELVISGQR